MRSSVLYAEPIQRAVFTNVNTMYLYGTKGLSVEFALHFSTYREFLGEQHFETMFRLVGLAGFSTIVTELSNHVTLIVMIHN